MHWSQYIWRHAAVCMFLLAWGLFAYWLVQQVTQLLTVFFAWYAPRGPTEPLLVLVRGLLYAFGIFLAYCSALLAPLVVLVSVLSLVARMVTLADDVWPPSTIIDAEWTLPVEEDRHRG